MSEDMAALFKRLTQGVYVIGVADGSSKNAFTAAWVMQVSFDPLLIAVSVNARHSSFTLLERSRAFSVNVLKKDQLPLAAHFGRPAAEDKLASVAWTSGRTGVPLLDEVAAWFECRVTDKHSAGDHVVVLGEVVNGRLLDPAADLLTYRDTGDMDGAASLYAKELR
jgi:flavin reductase (DIM6/NTAB) family NADH-FMN oxidoreductase RutF